MTPMMVPVAGCAGEIEAAGYKPAPRLIKMAPRHTAAAITLLPARVLVLSAFIAGLQSNSQAPPSPRRLRLGAEHSHRAVVLMRPIEIHESIVARLAHFELEHRAGARANHKVVSPLKKVGRIAAVIDGAEHDAGNVKRGGKVRTGVEEEYSDQLPHFDRDRMLGAVLIQLAVEHYKTWLCFQHLGVVGNNPSVSARCAVEFTLHEGNFLRRARWPSIFRIHDDRSIHSVADVIQDRNSVAMVGKDARHVRAKLVPQRTFGIAAEVLRRNLSRMDVKAVRVRRLIE